jgi:DNA-binding response OmpR family regulator
MTDQKSTQKKILIIEDDKFLSNAYRLKLDKAGFITHLSKNGKEGLLAVESFKPNLILLDLVMPIMDGFATLEKLKENKNTISVLIASNLGQKEDIDRGLALGAKDFIIKSDISLDDLIKKINSLLS